MSLKIFFELGIIQSRLKEFGNFYRLFPSPTLPKSFGPHMVFKFFHKGGPKDFGRGKGS